jgi:hypothetical protein
MAQWARKMTLLSQCAFKKAQKQAKEWIRGFESESFERIRGFESESFEDSIRRDSGFGNPVLSEITNFVMRYAAARGELAVERLARWDESVTVIADKSLQKKEGKNHSDGWDCSCTKTDQALSQRADQARVRKVT